MDMRSRNQGTWDKSVGCWRVKGAKIQKSPRQLSKIFGEDVPANEAGSRPFWNRYLAEIYGQQAQQQRINSPLQQRIASIDLLLANFRAEGKTAIVEALEKELAHCVSVPADDSADNDFADIPVAHPAAEPILKVTGSEDCPIAIGMLNNQFCKIKKESRPTLKSESIAFLGRKHKRAQTDFKGAINLLLSTTGECLCVDFNVEHWRKFCNALNAHATWGDATRHKNQKRAIEFLHQIEMDHTINYSFLKNKSYRLQEPEGKKEKWTMEQIKTALANAQGSDRAILLLGLNCGFYRSDILSLKPEMICITHLSRSRKKLEHQKGAVGSWLLWDQTKAAISAVGTITSKHFKLWDEFRAAHNLPEQSDLRKTVAQLIQDHCGEEQARLYRCEKTVGTHGKNYIDTYSPIAVGKLDEALRQIEKMIF